MPRRISSRRSTASKAARGVRAVVDALEGTEAKQLLRALLDAHPELQAEVAELADAELAATTVEGVAEEVASALDDLSIEDVWAHAGNGSDGSYVEPAEAGWDVIEKAVAPFLGDLTRRVGLGRRTEATTICQGILLGLYRVSQREGEFLDGHTTDTLEEMAYAAVKAWKSGARGKARSRASATEVTAMRAFVSKRLPEWRSFLSRSLGR